MVDSRIMAIDVGEKRLGIAVSDPIGITAQPLTCLERTDVEEDIKRIGELVEEIGVSKIVLGYPLTLEGSEGSQALQVRELGNEISEILGVPVEYYDERFTTVESERGLKQAGLRRRKRRAVVDKVAASLILQAYLRRSSGGDETR